MPQHGPHALKQRALLLLSVHCLALLCLVGCRPGHATREVTRTMGGQERAGAFVSPFAYEHYVRAELAIAHGDLGAAIEELRMARLGPEDDAYVIARLAETLETAGRGEDADRVLEEGFELDADSEALWLARGRIANARGQTEAAIAAFARASELAPGSPHGPLALARTLEGGGASERARQVLVEFVGRARRGSAEALRARLSLAVARGDGGEAAEAVRALLAVAPARENEVRAAATTAMEGGRPLLAARLLDHLPRRPEDEALRVRALLAAGRAAEAEGVLTTAPPERFGGALEQASLFLEAGRPERAEELADAAVTAEPTPRGRLLRGQARLVLGRYDEAALDLSAVPAGTSSFVPARLALARALVAQGLVGLAAEMLAQSAEDAGANADVLEEALRALR